MGEEYMSKLNKYLVITSQYYDESVSVVVEVKEDVFEKCYNLVEELVNHKREAHLKLYGEYEQNPFNKNYEYYSENAAYSKQRINVNDDNAGDIYFIFEDSTHECMKIIDDQIYEDKARRKLVNQSPNRKTINEMKKNYHNKKDKIGSSHV